MRILMVLLCYESDTDNAMPGSARLVALCATLCLLRYVLCVKKAFVFHFPHVYMHPQNHNGDVFFPPHKFRMLREYSLFFESKDVNLGKTST